MRFRVDGDCFEYMKIPQSYRRAIVSRLKIMASLDIAERRKPQDGKIKFKLTENKEIELRVATIPTTGYNEDVVMRLLAASEPLPLDKMGFSDRNLQCIKDIADKPYGIILCVGPTGSGKTTTLHSVLGHINTPDIKYGRRKTRSKSPNMVCARSRFSQRSISPWRRPCAPFCAPIRM